MAISVGEIQATLSLKDQFSVTIAKVLDLLPSVGKQFEGVAIAAGVFGAAALAVTGAIVELGRHGSEVNDVTAGFDRLAGGIAPANVMLEKMRQGAAGTITDFKLMTDANHLLAVGAVKSADDLGTLTAASRVLSREFGGDMQESIEKVSRALETGRVGRLAMQGVTIDTVAAEAKYAAAHEITGRALDKTEKLEAGRAAVLEALQKVVKDAGDQELNFKEKIAQAAVGVENWVNQLGAAVAASPHLSAAFSAIETALSRAFGGDSQRLLDGIVHGIDLFADAVARATPKIVTLHDDVVTFFAFLEAHRAVIETIAVAIGTYTVATNAMSLATTSMKIGVPLLSTVLTTLSGVIGTLAINGVAGMTALGASLVALAGPAGVAAVAVAAIFAAWKLGHTEAVSDFFEKIGLRLQGFSGDAADAAIKSGHLMDTQDKLLATLQFVGPVLDDTKKSAMALGDAHEHVSTKVSTHEKAVQALLDKLVGEDKQLTTLVDTVKRLTQAQKDDIDVQAVLLPMIDHLIAAHQKVPPVLMAEYDAALESRIAIIEQGKELLTASGITLRYVDALKQHGLSEQEIATKLGVTATALKDYVAWLTELAKVQKLEVGGDFLKGIQELEHIGEKVDPKHLEAIYNQVHHIEFGVYAISAAAQSVGEHVKPAMKDLALLPVGFLEAFGETFTKIPQLLVASFTGGGGVIGAIKGFGTLVGGAFGESMFGSLKDGKVVGGLFAGMTGMLANLIPAIGPVIGALAGPLISAIGKLFGGPSKEELAARTAYTDWQTKLLANFELTATAQQKMEAGGVKWKETNIAVRDAYIAVGKSGDQAMHDLQVALDATHHSAAEVQAALASINAVLDEQKKDAADLDAAIKKYGFSIAELGPTMRKQELTKQAVQLENDFRLLAGSGIDLNTVLQHMGGSINDFLHLAQKTGTEVPTEMKPILEKMIELGTLTDANGNKITNLGAAGITFSETMTQGFQKIVDKLTELINKIAGTTGALNAIPTHITTEVDTFHNDYYKNLGDTSGGAPPTFGPEVYVPTPRLAVVGTHGGEVVLHKNTYDALMSGGGKGAEWGAVLDELGGIRAELAQQRIMMPIAIRDALQRA